MDMKKLKTENRIGQAVPLLLSWYRENARVFPWRETEDAYPIWVSEIMLQQTRIGAAMGYYARFLETFPTVEDLASSSEELLMKMWQGLGYYSRARNMQKAAITVTQQYGGKFPADYEALRSLPGIGEYTAAAIASASFGLPEAAVDGNVLRVFSRITDYREDIAQDKTRKAVRQFLLAEMTGKAEDNKIFNQALMELGETVCLPGNALRCAVCPVSHLCKARSLGNAEDLPVKTEKKPRKIDPMTVFLLLNGKNQALRKRPDKGLLAGLWEYPNMPGTLTEQDVIDQLTRWGFAKVQVISQKKAKHIFTHREWHMNGWLVRCEGNLPDGMIWAGPAEMEKLALPSAFASLHEAAEKEIEK